MDAKQPDNKDAAQPATDENSLEGTSTVTDTAGGGSDDGLIDTTADPSAKGPAPSPEKFKPPKRGPLQRFSIYLLLFGLLLVLAGVAVGIVYLKSKQAQTVATIKTQDLNSSTLKTLASTSANIGDPAQVLNIQSNAVFAGKVLVRDSLEVAGNMVLGGSLTLTGVNVSGDASFGSIEVSKDLTVSGNTSLQGTVTVQKSLNVNGTGTFSGAVSAPQITTPSLELNGDLVLTHHISAGGPTPTRSSGPALGAGGTASLSGSDTSGSVSINTGSGTAAGCFITINFVQRFNSVPHVLITPVGAGAANVGYYVTRTTSSFSICAANTPPVGQNFGFDYFVLD